MHIMAGDLLAIFESYGLALKPHARDEYTGACPFCGDGGKGAKSDRFHFWTSNPKWGKGGHYWCRQCKKSGDGIQFLRDHCGLSYRAACDAVGAQCDTFLKTPTLATLNRDKKTFTPVADAEKQNLDMIDPDAWQKKARALVAWATECLVNTPEKMEYLARRGIDAKAVRRYRLGYIPGEKGKKCLFRPRKAWGIPDKIDKKSGETKNYLWIPRGIVVPYITGSGDDWRVERIRIRRNDEDVPTDEHGKKKNKYIVLDGSPSKDMMWLDCATPTHTDGGMVVVTEAELDAIALHSVAGDLFHCVSSETAVISHISHTTNDRLKKAACILVALDRDESGEKGTPAWLATFPRAKRWPCPGAKDPGDAVAAGLDLRLWLVAGIPDGLLFTMPQCPCPARVFEEEEGGQKEEGRAPEVAPVDPPRDVDNGNGVDDLPPEMAERAPYYEEYKGVYGVIRCEDGKWIPPDAVRGLYELWKCTPIVYTRERDDAGNVVGFGFTAHAKWMAQKACAQRYRDFMNFVGENPIIWDWLSLHLANEITASNLFRLHDRG